MVLIRELYCDTCKYMDLDKAVLGQYWWKVCFVLSVENGMNNAFW